MRKTDELLLARLHRGDAAAVEAFYEGHVDGLYAFVFYRVGRDPTIAEDVVQDTFVQALDRLGEYDASRGSLRSWLSVLSRNVIRQHLRHARKVVEAWERIDRTLADVFAAIDREPLADDVLAREETRDLVHMTIANLPDRYRVALEAKYVAGRSMRDLAGDLELSEDAAKSLLARARRAFRETFATLSETMTAEVSA